jgi:hypothetical protein
MKKRFNSSKQKTGGYFDLKIMDVFPEVKAQFKAVRAPFLL